MPCELAEIQEAACATEIGEIDSHTRLWGIIAQLSCEVLSVEQSMPCNLEDTESAACESGIGKIDSRIRLLRLLGQLACTIAEGGGGPCPDQYLSYDPVTAPEPSITFSDFAGMGTLTLRVVSAGYVELQSSAGVVSLVLPVAVTLTDGLFLQTPTLVSLSAPLLVTCGEIACAGATSLADVSLPSWLPTNGSSINFNSCALTEASVDHILARCVANPAYVSGTVDLAAGTNAPPGVQGQADVLILQGRGCTVNTN